MPTKINFDINGVPETPTLVLSYRNGDKIGAINAKNIIVKGSMINPNEISFEVYKYVDNQKNYLWDLISDFMLVWHKENDLWFEAYVEINESNDTIKMVSCKQLGRAELSQIKLYNVEINTENDIARDDYIEPTVFYNPEKKESSLLNRIMEKAPHYSIKYVDKTLMNLQRTFTFDDVSIDDGMQQISEEIGCLFVLNSNSDSNNIIERTVSVYDLRTVCNQCGHRGEYTSLCPKCGSNDVNEGYGEDTTIFVTSDELGDNIRLVTDVDSVKNCFKLEAGDDLMTATIRNCNPNGTDYIWHISEDTKQNMSKALVEKIDQYDDLYNSYQTDRVFEIDNSLIMDYNKLVEKYKKYNDQLNQISVPIQGYSSLMMILYDAIDMSLFLNSALMPSVEIQNTNAKEQCDLLTTSSLSPVAVANIKSLSLATANSAVLSIAKIIVDSRYQIKINQSNLNTETKEWNGSFVVTNYSDEEDTCISNNVSIVINDGYENFIKQKIDKSIKDKESEDLSIKGLFNKQHDIKLDHSDRSNITCPFCIELTKYGLQSLMSFRDACQACIDILIEQGLGDNETWGSGSDDLSNLYKNLYEPYYEKLIAIENEINIRQNEIGIIDGIYDSENHLIQNGIQSAIFQIVDQIHRELDFEKYIGNDLWIEFCSYRREDKYVNENYISDGLNNSEIFKNALDFIDVAKDEIYKSSELQHSITSDLKNLLSIEKFKPLIKYFNTGNWIRIQVDDKIYKLRLIEYEINFNDLDMLSVDFSDVLKLPNGESDQKSIISKMTSITSSYNAVQKQVNKSKDNNQLIDNWNNDGLDVTHIKIISNSDGQTQTWDSHGMLFRQYDYITDSYDDKQLKIINSTIAMTDDNWNTTKTAIGNFYYRDPKTNELKNAYGINGEVIIGKLVIGEGLGIYNESGSLNFDDNGFIVTNGINTVTIDPNDDSIFNIKNTSGNVLSFDDDGNLIVVGNISAKSLTLLDNTKLDSNSIAGLANVALTGDYSDLSGKPQLSLVATSGNYNDLSGAPVLASVATSGRYSDLSGTPIIQSTITSSGSSPVSGKAVYDYALSKNQGSSNAGKLFYIDTNGEVTLISLNELKGLLGV